MTDPVLASLRDLPGVEAPGLLDRRGRPTVELRVRYCSRATYRASPVGFSAGGSWRGSRDPPSTSSAIKPSSRSSPKPTRTCSPAPASTSSGRFAHFPMPNGAHDQQQAARPSAVARGPGGAGHRQWAGGAARQRRPRHSRAGWALTGSRARRRRPSSYVWPSEDGWPYPDSVGEWADQTGDIDDDLLWLRAKPPNLFDTLDPLERRVITSRLASTAQCRAR